MKKPSRKQVVDWEWGDPIKMLIHLSDNQAKLLSVTVNKQ